MPAIKEFYIQNPVGLVRFRFLVKVDPLQIEMDKIEKELIKFVILDKTYLKKYFVKSQLS